MRASVLLVLILVFTIYPPPLSAGDRALDVSRAVLWLGAGLDAGSTVEGIQNGRHEGNPVFHGFRNNPVAITATMLSTVAATDFATHMVATHGHPRLAAFLNCFVGGLHFGAGVHNFQ